MLSLQVATTMPTNSISVSTSPSGIGNLAINNSDRLGRNSDDCSDWAIHLQSLRHLGIAGGNSTDGFHY